MKQRIISSFIGVVILIIVVVFYNTIFFNVTMAFISLLAVGELLNATKLIKYAGFLAIGIGFSIVFPFYNLFTISWLIPVLMMIFGLIFTSSVIKYHNSLSFEQITMGLVFALFVPLILSSPIYLRDSFGGNIGIYYLMLALGSAWFSDSGAYFSGLFFGKHKLAPVISPKKTWEGAIGGVLTATACNVLLAMGITLIFKLRGITVNVNYFIIALISPFIAVSGIIGDLVASVIKRQHNVKDYGHIMPGHGGVMDRFDSVMMTLPTVYIFSQIIGIAK